MSISKYPFQTIENVQLDDLKSLLHTAAMIGCRVFDKNTPRQVGGVNGSCKHTSKLMTLDRKSIANDK